jgi:hypothetical protein
MEATFERSAEEEIEEIVASQLSCGVSLYRLGLAELSLWLWSIFWNGPGS